MPMVYIQCPVTNDAISTNHIVADLEKLDTAINRNLPIACPACNGVHIWNDKNGFFLTPGAKSAIITRAVGL